MELKESSLDFIKNLVNDMKEQDCRCTQNVVFVIQEDYRNYNDNGCKSERLEDFDIDDLCNDCGIKYDNGEDLPEECNDCEDDCFVWYDIEERIDTNQGSFFLTEKACEEHIRLNHYHYNNPRSYGISLWRNPEMTKLINILFEIAGEQLPNNYDKIISLKAS